MPVLVRVQGDSRLEKEKNKISRVLNILLVFTYSPISSRVLGVFCVLGITRIGPPLVTPPGFIILDCYFYSENTEG